LILRVLIVLLAVLALGGGAISVYWRNQYPYGWSHCCDLCLGGLLIAYADEHDGHFPAGEKTPEASLSLLYLVYPKQATAELLRGKTVPVEVVQAILDRGERLGPDSCGWHYVEGLTLADNPKLALFWDKAGLGHNGERLREGGHRVIMLNGMPRYVSAAEWPEFMKEQQALLAERVHGPRKGDLMLSAKVRLPSGDIVDHLDASFILSATMAGPPGSMIVSSTREFSGATLRRRDLRWTAFDSTPLGEGRVTLVLESRQKKWRSKPVTVEIKDGVATPSSIIFEMEIEAGR
jgi:hypothetical protein